MLDKKTHECRAAKLEINKMDQHCYTPCSQNVAGEGAVATLGFVVAVASAAPPRSDVAIHGTGKRVVGELLKNESGNTL